MNMDILAYVYESKMADDATFTISSYIQGYHEYKDSWNPVPNQCLETKAEVTNIVDRYAVAVLQEDEVVGHLPKGKLGRYAKTISFFFTASVRNTCLVIVSGRAVNLGDGKGMQVPCQLKFEGLKLYIETLRTELEAMEL